MNNIAFAYHPMSGAYLGEVECQANPLEFGLFIVPGSATDVKPPKPTKGKWPVWTGEKWELKAVTAE